MSLKKGGAGEIGFCYEAGASVEVAPEEALGSGEWGEKKKHQKRSTQGGAAQRSLQFTAADIWVDQSEGKQKTSEPRNLGREKDPPFSWTSAIVSLSLGSSGSSCHETIMRRSCDNHVPSTRRRA